MKQDANQSDDRTFPPDGNRSDSKRSRRDNAGGRGGSSRLREEEEEEGDLLDGIDEERLLEVSV